MKKLLLILICSIIAIPAFASSSNSTKYYKMNQYNSKGQKVGYTKVYYKGDKSNVKKVEKYNTKGKRTELHK